jgi:hypothetical protein
LILVHHLTDLTEVNNVVVEADHLKERMGVKETVRKHEAAAVIV